MEVLDDSYKPSQPVLNIAPLWRRALASMIDLIIVVVVSYGFLAIVAYVFLTFGKGELRHVEDGSDVDRFFFMARIFAMFSFVLLSFLYFSVLESSWKQGTFGKILVGISVGKANGGKMSFLNSSGRYLVKILSVAILFIGCIMAAFDSKKRALHDRVADTYVFRK
jgi:uncharacterized RDD family membrane protein YckC